MSSINTKNSLEISGSFNKVIIGGKLNDRNYEIAYQLYQTMSALITSQNHMKITRNLVSSHHKWNKIIGRSLTVDTNTSLMNILKYNIEFYCLIMELRDGMSTFQTNSAVNTLNLLGFLSPLNNIHIKLQDTSQQMQNCIDSTVVLFEQYSKIIVKQICGYQRLVNVLKQISDVKNKIHFEQESRKTINQLLDEEIMQYKIQKSIKEEQLKKSSNYNFFNWITKGNKLYTGDKDKIIQCTQETEKDIQTLHKRQNHKCQLFSDELNDLMNKKETIEYNILNCRNNTNNNNNNDNVVDNININININNIGSITMYYQTLLNAFVNTISQLYLLKIQTKGFVSSLKSIVHVISEKNMNIMFKDVLNYDQFEMFEPLKSVTKTLKNELNLVYCHDLVCNDENEFNKYLAPKLDSIISDERIFELMKMFSCSQDSSNSFKNIEKEFLQTLKKEMIQDLPQLYYIFNDMCNAMPVSILQLV